VPAAASASTLRAFRQAPHYPPLGARLPTRYCFPPFFPGHAPGFFLDMLQVGASVGACAESSWTMMHAPPPEVGAARLAAPRGVVVGDHAAA
jgi:hypothetical protein